MQQESDWVSFVDTLVSDNTTDGHAQNVQSPLSVVCHMPPAYYWQPLIALPPMAPMQNVQPANQQPLLFHPPVPPPPPPTPLATRALPTPSAPTPAPTPAPPPAPPPPPSPESDRLAALKEEARTTVEATTQRKTKRVAPPITAP